ncbi:hypothetical protein Tco_1201984 [Tanacetum coccineum]
MSNQSEDIKAADHGEYILQSIDEGPFKMGKCRDEIVSGPDGPYLGPERVRVFTDLSQPEKDRLKADVRATNILLQGLTRDIYKLINHNMDAKDIWDNMKMLLEGFELTKDDRESHLYDEFEHFDQHKGENIHDYYGRFVTTVKLNRGLKESNHDQLYAYLKQHEYSPSSSSVPPQPSYIPLGRQNRVQGNNTRGAVAAGNRGAQNRAGGQTNTFDDDVDEGPLLLLKQCSWPISPLLNQFMMKLVHYDSNILSEVQDHDNCLDNMNEYHEEHEMQNFVQLNDIVNSATEYTSNSNIISYEQYVQDTEDQVVHSDVSFVPNDAVMMITNDIYDQDAQCVTSNKPNKTVNASLTTELARYKELAEVYKKGPNLN